MAKSSEEKAKQPDKVKQPEFAVVAKAREGLYLVNVLHQSGGYVTRVRFNKEADAKQCCAEIQKKKVAEVAAILTDAQQAAKEAEKSV